MAAILKNDCHFEIGSHFEFGIVKFGLPDLKFIKLSDAKKFFLEFLLQEKCIFISIIPLIWRISRILVAMKTSGFLRSPQDAATETNVSE